MYERGLGRPQGGDPNRDTVVIPRRLPRSALAAALAVACMLLVMPPAGAMAPDPQGAADEPLVWRVRASAQQAAALLRAGFDVARSGRGAAMVIGNRPVAQRLRELGYEPAAFDTVYRPVPPEAPRGGDTFYGGYRTVAAHEAHLERVAATYPELATVVDIGDSWLRATGSGGHAIKAICLTKIQDGDCELHPDVTKPRFALMAGAHPREIAAAELAWRWIDYLAGDYGSDPDATSILDTTEVWVIPVANPDGADIVASGGDQPKLQRKNVDTSNGNCSGTLIGVDLNRNSSFHWGGAFSDPCADNFRGPSAVSEPETEAHEQFFSAIYPRQRSADDTTPAPDDAQGVMITLHSYGDNIVVPWGWTNDPAPNDQQLRELGRTMATSNNYKVGNNADTVGYLTPGATDDYTYGVLGVASFTFEVGAASGRCGGFLPAYSCVDATFWPENKGAFISAAKAAAAPYLTS